MSIACTQSPFASANTQAEKAQLQKLRPAGWYDCRALLVQLPGQDHLTRVSTKTMDTGEISIRVRYAETDRMGLLHHANYLIYLEQARTEMLREQGLAYRDLEDQGFFLVITKLEVKYRQSIRYDDIVTIRTTVARTTFVRID